LASTSKDIEAHGDVGVPGCRVNSHPLVTSTSKDIEAHGDGDVPGCRVDSQTLSLHSGRQRVGYDRVGVVVTGERLCKHDTKHIAAVKPN